MKWYRACAWHSGRYVGSTQPVTLAVAMISPRVCHITQSGAHFLTSSPAVLRHSTFTPAWGTCSGCAPCPGCSSSLSRHASPTSSLWYHIFSEVYADHPIKTAARPSSNPQLLSRCSRLLLPLALSPFSVLGHLSLASFSVYLLTWERQLQEGRGPYFIHWYTTSTWYIIGFQYLLDDYLNSEFLEDRLRAFLLQALLKLVQGAREVSLA